MRRFLFKFIPKNYLSHFTGWLAHIPLPKPLSTWLIRAFAGYYRIDIATASKSLEGYSSIGDFFVRDLKPGLRPISGELVSPVDGTLRSAGRINNGVIEQVKGKTYTVTDLLQDKEIANRYRNGIFFNFYLAPCDYHHVHAPVNGEIIKSVHIKGNLWPVTGWAINSVDQLFCVNERVITYIKSKFGLVAVVMVGAFNVGRISVDYDSIVGNQVRLFGQQNNRLIDIRSYDSGISIQAGQRLGTFHLGSSVVVLMEKDGLTDTTWLADGKSIKVQYGQSLIA